MKCSNCGADLYDGVLKCPFCKESTGFEVDDRFKNMDCTYKVSSGEDMKAIKNAVMEVSKETTEKIKREARRKEANTERRKRNALKRANSDHVKIYAVMGIIAILAISIIVSIFAGIGAIISGFKPVSPTVYMRENQLYQVYKNKSVVIAEKTIKNNIVFNTNKPEKPENIVRADGLVKFSNDRKYTYFFENYDANTKSGDLNVVIKGKAKSKQLIAKSVYPSVILSSDGQSVLFLQNADAKGTMGVLHYWNIKSEQPVKITSDMDNDTFMFSKDEKEIMFIQNFDHSSKTGDLYAKKIKNLDEEKTKIDSEVCAVFGTNVNGTIYVYAKNYNPSNGAYDVYVRPNNSDKIRVSEQTKLAPVISDKSDKMFVYGAVSGNEHTLYIADLKNGQKDKITSGVSSIIKISDDEKNIIYAKAYENNTADYYIYSEGRQTQKVASNVNNYLGENHPDVSQVCISDDFSKICYIEGFDTVKEGGQLYSSEINKGKVSEAKKIDDDVYSCYIMSDNKITYAKNYDKNNISCDIYIDSSGKTENVTKDVSADLFNITKDGNNIVGINNYDNIRCFGTLNIFDSSKKNINSIEKVNAFGRKSNGQLLYFVPADVNNLDLYVTNGNKFKGKLLDNKVTAIIAY